eukprot:Nitzschia sp. Nitz4//scaffold374_size14026//11909//13288//NITZ4_008961-RA/size14026-processed-gene-0.4-mRNA-1//-1//CDS//3329549629//8697//frame0
MVEGPVGTISTSTAANTTTTTTTSTRTQREQERLEARRRRIYENLHQRPYPGQQSVDNNNDSPFLTASAGGTPTKQPSNNSGDSPDTVTQFRHDSRDSHEAHVSLHQFLQESPNHSLTLYIDDYQESTFDRIVSSLYGNSTLQHLAIERLHPDRAAGSTTYRTVSEMTCLFEALVCLPQLRTLSLSNMQTKVLTRLALHVPNSLEDFYVSGDVPKCLFEKLATLPKLAKVVVESPNSLEGGILLSNPSLRMIRLKGRHPTDHLVLVASLIQSFRDHPQSALTTLDLDALLDGTALQSLLEALQSNQHLVHFHFRFRGENDADAVVLALAEWCRDHPTLTHVANHLWEEVPARSASTHASVLATLQSAKQYRLQQFEVCQEDFLFWMAKGAMLSTTTTTWIPDDVATCLREGYESFPTPSFQKSWDICGGWTTTDMLLDERMDDGESSESSSQEPQTRLC